MKLCILPQTSFTTVWTEACLGLEKQDTVYKPWKWKHCWTLKHSSVSRCCCNTQIQMPLSDLFLKPVQEKWHREIEFFALYFNSSLSCNLQIKKCDHHETNPQPDTQQGHLLQICRLVLMAYSLQPALYWNVGQRIHPQVNTKLPTRI